MQDPNADTEWNDVLRAKGILPPKEEKEVTEDDIVGMLEQTIQEKNQGKSMEQMSLDELNLNEDDVDEEEERIFEAYRRQRMQEIAAAQNKGKFGSVREISKDEYVREVNKAGEGVWVVLHVYKQGIPLCSLINNHINVLAQKFPATKFLRSVSSVCIPNYPDKNLPTIFIYFEGDLKKQYVGPLVFGGMDLTQDDFELMLDNSGAVKSDLEEDEKKITECFMEKSIRTKRYDSDDEDDWD